MQTVLLCIAFVCVRLSHCSVCFVSVKVKPGFDVFHHIIFCIFGTLGMKVIYFTRSSCVDKMLTWERFCQRHVYIARNGCYLIRPGYKEYGQ